MTNFIIALFVAITVFVLFSALRNKIPRTIGLRNVWRRKSNTILVVIGSMIATCLITSSLVLQDSLDKTFYTMVLENEGEIDARVDFQEKGVTTSPLTYIADRDLTAVEQALHTDDIDGVLPMYQITASPFVLDKEGNPRLQAYNIQVRALDPEAATHFGSSPPKLSLASDSLSDAIVGKGLADELDAQVGDTVAFTFFDHTFTLKIKEIVDPNGIVEDRGLVVQKKFITDSLQLPEHSAQIMLVSKTGGVRPDAYDGQVFQTSIEKALENVTLEKYDIDVYETKSEALDGYGMGNFVSILLAISIFGSLVGTLLIVSLYSMLATERKSEMGILRAIGFTRGDLVKTFVYEGFIYSLLASCVGVLAGIGVGSILVNQFTSMFGSLFETVQEGPTLDFVFSYSSTSLAIGAASGFLFTIITVMLASYVFSKINIVNAIRRLPEIKFYRWSAKTIFSLGLKALMFIAGIGSLIFSYKLPSMFQTMRDQSASLFQKMTDAKFTQTTEVYAGYAQFIGITLIIWFSALIFVQLVKITKQKDWSRYIFRIASVISILFNALIQQFDALQKAIQYDAGMALFFISGGMLVVSAAVLIGYSLTIIVRVIEITLKRFSSLTSVFRMGLRYPDSNVGRTGMTMIMFSLIIFLVVFISSVKTSINNATDEMTVNAMGGYTIDIMFNENANQKEITDARTKIQANSDVESAVTPSYLPVTFPDYADRELPPSVSAYSEEPANEGEVERLSSTVTALPKELVSAVRPVISEKLPAYADDEAVWKALDEDSSKVVLGTWFDQHRDDTLIDGQKFPDFKLGDTIRITDPSKSVTVEKQIIALLPYEGEGFGGINSEFTRNIIGGSQSIVDSFDEAVVSKFAYREMLVREKDGVDRADLVKDIKKELLGANISMVMDINVMLGAAFALINSIFLLLEGFLSLNLLIGSAGLAIIIARAVHERRQQIGMLRSLGFQRVMVLGVFFLESTFIAFLSIVIGISTGLVSVYSFFEIFMRDQGMDLVYPVKEITIIVAGVYVVAILLSLWPAYKASRLEPVEATNYPE
ncbi:MAG: FtsX-like permease family protein [Patescibacteria group bacterium]